jgi:hypothetical protein
MNDMHLGAVIRVLTGPLFRALRVDVLPDPHPPEPVPALDPDAPVGRFVNKIADRTEDLPLLMVDAHWVIDGN